ncbi:unnamed protein product, partial [Oppiella nova]
MTKTSDNSVIIRKMTKSDVSQALDVFASHGYYEITHSVQTFLAVDSQAFYVAIDTTNDMVIGCCGGPFLRPDTAFIGLYGVRREYFGSGIGQKLFARVMAYIGDRDCCLFSVPGKELLYKERLGFRVETGHELHIYYGRRGTGGDGDVNNNRIDGYNNGVKFVSKLSDSLLAKVCDYDRDIHGCRRSKLLELSLREPGCETVVAVCADRDCVVGYGCIRDDSAHCGSLCPVYADGYAIARRVVQELINLSENALKNGYYYYTISTNERAVRLAQDLHLDVMSREPLLCRNFVTKNVNKTSPQCIVHVSTLSATGAQKYSETGRTEVIRNTRNPEWTVRVPIDYRFNECQTLRLEVWDYDICADNELLGHLDVDVSALIASREPVVKKRLRLPAPASAVDAQQPYHSFQVTGELWLTIYEVLASKQTVRMQFAAKTLPQKDFLGSSDPYVVVSKESTDGAYTPVHRTEVIHKTLAPEWSEFTVRVHDLCDGDHHKRLRLAVYDWDRHTSDDFIGAVSTSLHDLNRQLTAGAAVLELRRLGKDITNSGVQLSTKRSTDGSEGKASKRRSILLRSRANESTNCGVLLVSKLQFRSVPTFVDYMSSAGTQIHFVAAVDCTSDSQSYHQRPIVVNTTGGTTTTTGAVAPYNCFEYIIDSLGQVLHPYDYQGLYVMYGFGARPLPGRHVSHAFNMKTDSVVPYCDGVDDMRRCYRAGLKLVDHLSSCGGRQFAPVLNEVLALTKNFQNGKHYFVVTIITAGSHGDSADTLEAIVRASAMPLSIVIVGVGN